MNTLFYAKNLFTLTVCLIGSVLIGCAPSDSADSGFGSSNTNAINGSATKALNVDRDFVFDSSFLVELQVSWDSIEPTDAYMSVCNELTVDGQLRVDYENCILRARLSEDGYNAVFKLPAHQDRLAIAIWPLDITVKPTIKYLNKEDLRIETVNIEI